MRLANHPHSTVATPGESSVTLLRPSPGQAKILDHARREAGSASLKFDRAQEHFTKLEADIQDYLGSQPYVLVAEDQSKDRLVQLWRMRVLRPAPKHLSAVIGDCIQNLRSALDHIVWERSRIYTGSPVANTQFPIVSLASDYPEKSKRPTRGLSQQAKDLVERFQPYHHGDAADGHPFALLADLSNVDKHRAIVLAAAAIGDVSFSLSEVENAQIESVMMAHGLVRDGEVMARVRLRHVDPTNSWQGHLQAHLTTQVAFEPDGPGNGLPVQRTLAQIRQSVAEALFALSSPYII